MQFQNAVDAGTVSQNQLCELLFKVVFTVTGPLKEKQIAYVCRETLQVRIPLLLTWDTSVDALLHLLCKNIYTATTLIQLVS